MPTPEREPRPRRRRPSAGRAGARPPALEQTRRPAAPASPIRRRALREQVHEELLRRVHAGALAPGDRLRDVALAADLGVSRTPVREALLRLAREGVVEADQGRGFLVRPLSARQVREMYPLVWTLECLALRLSPLPSPARLNALDGLNARLGEARRDPERLLQLDARWHELLLSGCPNETLLGLLRALKDGLRRYELAYMREAGRVALSTEHHARVTAALRAGDGDGAVHWLERNWRVSVEELTAWLEPGGRAAARAAAEAAG